VREYVAPVRALSFGYQYYSRKLLVFVGKYSLYYRDIYNTLRVLSVALPGCAASCSQPAVAQQAETPHAVECLGKHTESFQMIRTTRHGRIDA
jgi:hypothetical protein